MPSLTSLLAADPTEDGIGAWYSRLVLEGRDKLKRRLVDLYNDPAAYLADSAGEIFPTPEEALGIVESSRAGRQPEGLGMEKIRNLGMGLIFAGPGAKTADLLKLNLARQMEQAGASADDILTNTGWFKGMEGKWKFEIPDNALRFSTGPLTGGQKVPVGDVLDHPDLYAAYPFLRGMKAQPMPPDVPSGAVGMFQGPANPNGLVSLAQKARRDTALHEMQHAIQEQEGFALGGGYEAPDLYRRLAGEIEARNVQMRMLLSPQERISRPPWMTQDIPQEQAIVRVPTFGP